MGIIKDPTSWRTGFELGLAGFSFPYSKHRKPTAYLYNGIRLPALPEWDRGVYPYAAIICYTNTGTTDFDWLILSTSPMSMKVGSWAVYLMSENAGSSIRYVHTTLATEWERREDKDFEFESDTVIETTIAAYRVVWSNVDMTYHADTKEGTAGELFLSASDPVPVYE